jgi:hypothetical protein
LLPFPQEARVKLLMIALLVAVLVLVARASRRGEK